MTSKHVTYIENYAIPEIMAKLEGEQLITFKAEHSKSVDSFMSSLYFIQLKTKTSKGEKERLLLAKFMRGDVSFRETSKSYILYANEIYTYNKILPEYEILLRDLNVNQFNVRDLVAPNYISKFGYVEGLSCNPDDREALLVLEHLKPQGYQLGPRLVLNLDHLLGMCKPIAKWHAISYALKAIRPQQFDNLTKGIIVLPFLNDNDPNDASNNGYRIAHRHAFDRLYEFYDRKLKGNFFDNHSAQDKKLMECMENLRRKYFELPSKLQENLRTKVLDTEEDRYFATLLHGDYNRNNVLFKYKTEIGEDGQKLVEDVKLIDFQQLRFASPVLDLSFFMYFNSNESERYHIWPVLLRTYHEIMFTTLSSILNASEKSQEEIEEILYHYSFEKFEKHFARFAFYGVVICLHFLQWMLCSEDMCVHISELFATDINGAEFRRLCLEVGGDEVNMRLLAIIRHACDMGYMDEL